MILKAIKKKKKGSYDATKSELMSYFRACEGEVRLSNQEVEKK